MDDIRLDTDGDLLIQDGDFVIGDCSVQNVRDIIESFTGWWKEFPSIGVGISSYDHSSGKQQELESKIKLQLKADGKNINIQSKQNADGKFSIIINQ